MDNAGALPNKPIDELNKYRIFNALEGPQIGLNGRWSGPG